MSSKIHPKDIATKGPVAPLPQPNRTPEPTSVWAHSSGTLYTVIAVSSKPDEGKELDFPVTVFYLGPDGRKWTRTLKRWHASMTFVAGADFKPGTLMSFVSVAVLLWRAACA